MKKCKRLRILIVSSSPRKRNAIAKWIVSGCEMIALDIEGIYLTKSISDSTEKIDQADIDVVLCDKEILKWREIQDYFESRNPKKIFLLLDDNGQWYDDISVDGVFCLRSLRAKREQVCSLIHQMINI